MLPAPLEDVISLLGTPVEGAVVILPEFAGFGADVAVCVDAPVLPVAAAVYPSVATASACAS